MSQLLSNATDTLGSLLSFGSDLPLRRHYFVPESIFHPAKMHLGLLQWLVGRYTQPGEVLCDPMAGSGSLLVAALSGRHVVARDIEPRWVEIMQRNAERITEKSGLFESMLGHREIAQADAREAWHLSVDHVLCSPPYGCEMAATAHAKKNLVYRLHDIPHDHRWDRYLSRPTEGTTGMLTFHYGTHPAQIGHWRGNRYWQAMTVVYREAWKAIRPGGLLILVVKDHISDGQRIRTAEQTVDVCHEIGFVLHAHHQRRVYPLSLWQRRRKEQGLPVVEEEDVLVLRKV